jgi:hypothetical protein
MMRRWHLVAYFFAMAVVCSAQSSHLIEVLAEVAPTLRDTTSVPLRFPSHIPGLDKETQLYAITRSVDVTGYEVVLGATPDCQGQHVCSYGFLVGTTRSVSSSLYWIWRRRMDYEEMKKFGSHAGQLVTGHGMK